MSDNVCKVVFPGKIGPLDGITAIERVRTMLLDIEKRAAGKEVHLFADSSVTDEEMNEINANRDCFSYLHPLDMVLKRTIQMKVLTPDGGIVSCGLKCETTPADSDETADS